MTRVLLLALALLSAPIARAEPALWKVQGPHATVWLFGSIHALKPGLAWKTPKVEAAFAAADQLWLEVPNADDPAAMQPLILRYGIDPAHPLSTRLTPDDVTRLNADLKPLGMTEPQVDPMRPWLVAVMVDTAPILAGGYDPKSGVDFTFAQAAKAAGKPVMGFETLDMQIHYFADLPAAEELALLRSSLDDADKGPAQIEKMMSAWSAGDVGALDKLINEDVAKESRNLYKILLVDRNVRFAHRIAELAAGQGTYFVVVGAGHLAGPDSVQADLAKLGLTAVRQ